MERKAFGKSGIEVSVLGFGGSEIGFGSAPQEDVDRLLNSALDAGLNVIDTAECYIDSEEKIGKSVGHRRGEFHLFTKIGHSSGMPGADWDPKMLTAQVDRGLQRLKTDCVDLIQLHTCDEQTLRQGDVIDVVKRAKEAGKTRMIGYSGDRNDAAYAVSCGAFDALQTSCSVADQEGIDTYIAAAAKAGMGVIAKRPIANVAWSRGSDPKTYGHEYWRRLQKLTYSFLNAPTIDGVGIALRFTLAVPGVCTAIVGTKNPERWPENAGLLDAGPMAASQYAEIRERWNELKEPDWVGQG